MIVEHGQCTCNLEPTPDGAAVLCDTCGGARQILPGIFPVVFSATTPSEAFEAYRTKINELVEMYGFGVNKWLVPCKTGRSMWPFILGVQNNPGAAKKAADLHDDLVGWNPSCVPYRMDLLVTSIGVGEWIGDDYPWKGILKAQIHVRLFDRSAFRATVRGQP